MKSLLLGSLLLVSFPLFANYEKAIIRNIDEQELPQNFVEVSEEGLPQDHYLQLIQQMAEFQFTPLTEARAFELFEELKLDPRARSKRPGGLCSYRRAYIQNKLKKMDIVSGKFLVHCPANNGFLRLRERISNRFYTFANFHDANIVAVTTDSGIEFRVMDVQFEDSPMLLHEYLAELESSQKIRPEKSSGRSKGLCYWYISTPYFRY